MDVGSFSHVPVELNLKNWDVFRKFYVVLRLMLIVSKPLELGNKIKN
jgi:hypothetical protein